MRSIYSEEKSRSLVAKRLSVLPAVVGFAGVILAVVAGMASGITEQGRGWVWTVLAALLIAATVVSGVESGLYLGLAVMALAGFAAGDFTTLSEFCLLAVALFIVHVLVRFSLDARRPSRFGPGFVARHIGHNVAVCALMVPTIVVSWSVIERPPASTVWIPVGLVLASLPLFVRFAAEWLDDRERLSLPPVRAVAAACLAVGMLILVVIAAQARTGIESVAADEPNAAETVTTQPTTALPADSTGSDSRTPARFPALQVLIVVALIVVLLFVALRRPAAPFTLDDFDPAPDDQSFGFAIAGRADQQDEVVEVDDQDLAKLLRDLQLDMKIEQDPGRAIRFGYATIERRLAQLRLTRQDSETEREFLARALPSLGSAGVAMRSLTALFETARFSHEAVDETMRQTAVGAIDDLLAKVERLVEDEGSGDVG